MEWAECASLQEARLALELGTVTLEWAECASLQEARLALDLVNLIGRTGVAGCSVSGSTPDIKLFTGIRGS